MNVSKFLPKQKKTPTVVLQARIDKELRNKVNAVRVKMRVSWPELITAMFRSFLMEKE